MVLVVLLETYADRLETHLGLVVLLETYADRLETYDTRLHEQGQQER